MISEAQMQKIWDLSETILYQEAVEFMQQLVTKDGYDPLPSSQVRGLLNYMTNSSYSKINEFIIDQRERDWLSSKKNIKIFYTELEKKFTIMRTRRLHHDFQLIDDKVPLHIFRQQVDALMVYVAREFLQHLIAENNLLLQAKEEKEKQNKHQE